MITFKMDPQANAAYVEISSHRIVETVTVAGLNIDLDEGGKAVGIEILYIEDLPEPKPPVFDPFTAQVLHGASTEEPEEESDHE